MKLNSVDRLILTELINEKIDQLEIQIEGEEKFGQYLKLIPKIKKRIEKLRNIKEKLENE